MNRLGESSRTRGPRGGSAGRVTPRISLRAPTDPGVHVKRTRFVTLWTVAVPHTTGSFRGDTLVRLDVLGVVPTPRPQRGTPFAPRGPGGPFPASALLWALRLLAVHLAGDFVSFAWRYHRVVPCSSPPARDRAVDQPGVGKPGLQPAVTMETARSRARETHLIIRHVPPKRAERAEGDLVVFEELWGKWVPFLWVLDCTTFPHRRAAGTLFALLLVG